MSNIFLIADTHFGHENILKFKRENGHPLRPFTSLEEMHETLINNWNSVVRANDKVYCLGDMVIKRAALPILGLLNGTKILVKGNHDIFKLTEYLPYFKDVRGTHKLKDFMLSHVPIHPSSIPAWCTANVHGHLHSNNVKVSGMTDPKYICVSVEQIGYKPIPFELLI